MDTILKEFLNTQQFVEGIDLRYSVGRKYESSGSYSELENQEPLPKDIYGQNSEWNKFFATFEY